MGFEKALKSIEKNPRDAAKISAFLLLVSQEKEAEPKAEAYAGLAQALAAVDVVAAFEHVESAFKIAPLNGNVLRALVGLFERRGRRDAADAVRAYAKSEAVVPVSGGRRPDGRKDGREGAGRDGSGREGGARLAYDRPRSRLPSGRRKEMHDVRGLGAAAPAISGGAPAVTAGAEAARSARESDHCRALLREFGLDDGLMTTAAEFADPIHSVVSLVHFCHYLIFTGRLRSPSRAVAWVRQRIEAAPSPGRARDRARELLEDFDANGKER